MKFKRSSRESSTHSKCINNSLAETETMTLCILLAVQTQCNLFERMNYSCNVCQLEKIYFRMLSVCLVLNSKYIFSSSSLLRALLFTVTVNLL